MSTVTAQATLTTLVTHWRLHGLPDFVQFDNDTRFQGGHNHPDVVGRIIRLCLSLGVTPVFVPPRESGFQAVIEHFNGLWQTKVWARFHHADLLALTQRSQAFVGAYQQRLTQRAEVVLPRRPFPTPGGDRLFAADECTGVRVAPGPHLFHRWLLGSSARALRGRLVPASHSVLRAAPPRAGGPPIHRPGGLSHPAEAVSGVTEKL